MWRACASKRAFRIGVLCAILTPVAKVMAKRLKHTQNDPNEEHVTINSRLCADLPTHEEIRGAAYACVRCQVWLHESCAKGLQHLPREITHPLHSDHNLVLDWSGPDKEFTCDLCLKVSSGTNYGCCQCHFEVDLACAFAGGDDHRTTQRSDAERDHERIQHHCHRHPLILYKFSTAFFLHEFCTDKIPKTLNHPFNPSHPLRLGFHGYVKSTARSVLYCKACRGDVGGEKFNNTASNGCQECRFYLDIGCAKLLPTLKHECHHHSHTYVGPTLMKHLQNSRCHSCRELFSETSRSSIDVWNATSIFNSNVFRFPLQLKTDIIDIPSSYLNQLVKMRMENSPKPDSSSATVFMDDKDSELKEMEQTETTLFRPSLHLHPLKFFEATDENFKHGSRTCTACRLDVSGPGYFCEECLTLSTGIFLHENCAKLADEIQHSLHPQHRLILSATDWGFILCDNCQDISFGFVYRCRECDFKLDLKCATREPSAHGASTLKEWERETELFHFSHNHKLIFGNYPDTLRQIECRFCGLQILGPTYWCMRCNWFIHESLVRLPEEVRVPIHSQHSLTRIMLVEQVFYQMEVAMDVKIVASTSILHVQFPYGVLSNVTLTPTIFTILG
ncbi:hypothetical protein F3Y22_tig00112864pilonHSYRG00019 [Hibiscus syriacus]|uniref:DC1 domain-containing protein n=1 Tax=Hibiscus syriacus TaxID=106335 RepID=A0A6A2Y269_HIBSY|nr:hypothetical protein F3Y22_tig00112864pilonHSYRG00019 [Hibiscus syriacus]